MVLLSHKKEILRNFWKSKEYNKVITHCYDNNKKRLAEEEMVTFINHQVGDKILLLLRIKVISDYLWTHKDIGTDQCSLANQKHKRIRAL